MKIAKQLNVGWVTDDKGDLLFAIIDTKAITQSACQEANSRLEEGKCADGFVPLVFLDQKADTSELRASLNSEAMRRFAKS